MQIRFKDIYGLCLERLMKITLLLWFRGLLFQLEALMQF